MLHSFGRIFVVICCWGLILLCRNTGQFIRQLVIFLLCKAVECRLLFILLFYLLCEISFIHVACFTRGFFCERLTERGFPVRG